MVSFQRELFATIMPELPELLVAQKHEVDFNNKDLPLAMNWQQYINLEVSGALFVLTARSGRKLVGYFIAMVWPSLHYSQTLSSVSDIFYILPEYRNGTGAGMGLLKEAEKMLKTMGVTRCYMVTKVGSDASMIMGKLGYSHVENVHMKVLKNG